MGIQYYRNYISLIVNKPVIGTPSVPFSGKLGNAYNRNFEFPLGLSYDLFQFTKLKINVNVALVPVWTITKVNKLTEVPEGVDWSQEVVDAMHAVETIPKSFYSNYQYGLSVEYGKFELSLYQSANLNNSISDGYSLYDTIYPFQRRIRSTRIGLYYSLGLSKNKGE